MDEEAIPERDPAYELPGDGEPEPGSGESPTMSPDDARVWEVMVATRPALACLRG